MTSATFDQTSAALTQHRPLSTVPYKNDQTNFKNQELTNTRLIKENETLVHLNNELENELQSLEERFNELANCELFFDTVSNFVEFDAI